MASHWILNDAFFGTAKDLGHHCLPKKVFVDFLNDSMKDGIYRFNELNISNIYFLIGWEGSETYGQRHKKEELCFQDILSKDQYAYFREHKRIVLGIMEINKSDIRDDTYYIDWIDSFVPGYNIASLMMDKYNRSFGWERTVVPREFIEHSINYWLKKQCWNVYEADDYIEDLNEEYHIEDIGDEINWNVLYDKLEANDTSDEDCYRESADSDFSNVLDYESDDSSAVSLA